MKSKLLTLRPVARAVGAIERAREDRIAIYAAQSSFFLCISSVPLAALVISLTRLISPDAASRAISVVRDALPAAAREFFDMIADETAARSDFPIVSFAAAGLLWASSRGVSALSEGLCAIYGKAKSSSLAAKAASAIVRTVAFVVVITSVLAVTVFSGASVSHQSSFTLHFALGLMFVLIYSHCGGKSVKGSVPGAAFASVGWFLFTRAFSFYFEEFPRFSYLYGSLAAVAFFMLWVYFCVLILMFGAEINKSAAERRS